MSKGIFGNMFDLNRDGHLSCGEKSLEFMFLEKLSKEEKDKQKQYEKDNRDIDDDEDDEDDYCYEDDDGFDE
jgi:hypothetical protein